MACNTELEEILKGCDNNVGGLKKVYILPEEFLSSITVVAGEVTAMTLTSTNKFKSFEFNKGGASYTEPSAISLENGSTYFTQTLTMTIPKRELAKRQALALLTSGQRNLKVIVQDMNGNYWYMGYENSANVTELGEGSGVAKADGSKYSLTLIAEEPEQMLSVDSSIIAALVA